MARQETIRVEVGPETMKVLKAIRDALQNANEPEVTDIPDSWVRLQEANEQETANWPTYDN